MDIHPPDNTLLYQKLIEQDIKLEQLKHSVDAIKRYFLLSFIISVLMILLPIIAGAFAVPFLLNTFKSVNLPQQIDTLQKIGY